MKRKLNIVANVASIVALWSLTTLPLQAADQATRFNAAPGSKMRIEGSSLVHDWQAESSLIIGFLEVGPNFPTEPAQAVTPGKIDVRGEAAVMVRSLQSVEKSGAKYSDKMDDKMYEMLKSASFPRIVFSIKELVLKEAPKDKDSPYVFDSKGDLSVAGVTNTISFPVKVSLMPDKKVKIVASVPLKMSQFKIPPESILFVKTADDVTIKFEWMLRPGKTTTGTK